MLDCMDGIASLWRACRHEARERGWRSVVRDIAIAGAATLGLDRERFVWRTKVFAAPLPFALCAGFGDVAAALLEAGGRDWGNPLANRAADLLLAAHWAGWTYSVLIAGWCALVLAVGMHRRAFWDRVRDLSAPAADGDTLAG